MSPHVSSYASWRQSRWRVALWGSLALILLAPILAMQLTSEVVWGPEDFLFAGILLSGLGMGMEVLFRLRISHWARAAAVTLLLFAFLFIWAEAAVGVFR